ncbi:hypothetical protein NFI96_010725 [Prochilodus magdalenae]|nr:hypothetical protein NFI96_010725 [Prochilodus magdalenae]
MGPVETESLSTMQKAAPAGSGPRSTSERMGGAGFAENNPALLPGLDGLRRWTPCTGWATTVYRPPERTQPQGSSFIGGRCPTGCFPQDAAYMALAHKTLAQQDAAHRTLPAVFAPPQTNTTNHHVSGPCSAENDPPPPSYLALWGPVGVLSIEEQSNTVMPEKQMDFTVWTCTPTECPVMVSEGADIMARVLGTILTWERPKPWASPRKVCRVGHLFMSCEIPGQGQKQPESLSSRRSRLLQPQPAPSSGQNGCSRSCQLSEILEAACNASIPGLTGVSNFTVYLYCNLFDGGEATLDPEVSHAVPDLHASCSNAAWYLSAAEDDFLWVHVCSEFFAQEFNNTVCANSSFWLQRAHQVAHTLEHPHTVPADGAVGVEVEGHQAFWTCDDRPFILVLTTVPPHTVWYDTTAVFGDGDVVLRTAVVTVCVHVVLRGAAVCRWCCTNRMTRGGHHCSLEVCNGGCWVSQMLCLLTVAFPQAALSKDVFYLNQSSIDDLCLQLSADSSASSAADDTTEDCLVMLSTRSLSAHDFRRCFLPNDSALISSLCGNGSSPLPQEGWALEYCSKVLPKGPHADSTERPCDFSGWTADHFANSSMLELCGDAVGLRDYVCGNMSRYLLLVRKQPLLLDYCKANLEPKQDSKCVLQQLFDMLPAPYEFDTSQLCVNPMPILQEALYKLSLCEGVVDERAGWLATVSYVLRVLDFVVGLSAGLEEGEREVRQGLGQAILLSSLLDNASFWATLKPDASVSVLQTVGVFLRRERNLSLKEDLLSCFSPVLWDLIEKEDNCSALKFLIQEYLQMPRESIRSLVLSAEKDAVKRFLSHVHQSWDQLQVETIQTSPKEQEAMETMTAAFIHKFPRVTPELFVDLSQFIPYMSVSDIMSFPASLIVNDSVLMAIRDHSSEMKSPQKQAFAKRLLQSSVVGDVPSWPPYFLTSILPLLPHLPVSHFQQLTSQQLSPLMEFLANSSLDATRGRHVLRTLYSKRKNLTSETVMRLGILMCYLNSEELHRFLSTSPVSPALWQQLARCVSEGHVSESGRLSHWLGLTSRTLNTSIWSSSELASLHGVLPQLGASFFQTLSSSELLELFSIPGIPTFPPAQAFQVLSRIAQDTKISARTLCRLRPLWSGLAPAFLRNLSAPDMMGTSDCQCWSSLLTDPQPAHRAMVYRAVQQALEYSPGNITLYLHCLLPVTPLKKLATELNGHTVIHHLALYRNMAWSHQQAQLLFKMIQQTENITIETVL